MAKHTLTLYVVGARARCCLSLQSLDYALFPLKISSMISSVSYKDDPDGFFCVSFFLLQKLESFSLFEEASLFCGIGAMKRAMQMEELALTNA